VRPQNASHKSHQSPRKRGIQNESHNGGPTGPVQYGIEIASYKIFIHTTHDNSITFEQSCERREYSLAISRDCSDIPLLSSPVSTQDAIIRRAKSMSSIQPELERTEDLVTDENEVGHV
jgi:hypothetical protein